MTAQLISMLSRSISNYEHLLLYEVCGNKVCRIGRYNHTNIKCLRHVTGVVGMAGEADRLRNTPFRRLLLQGAQA